MNIFQRAKAAIKAAASKVSSLFTRAKNAVVSFIEPALKSRLARVIFKMARYSAFVVGAVLGVTALVVAPLVTLAVVAGAALLWVTWRFVLALLLDAESNIANQIGRGLLYIHHAFRFVGNVALRLFKAWSLAVVVATCMASVFGIIQFGLLFWLFWSYDVEETSSDLRERQAARQSINTARLASDLVGVVQFSRASSRAA